VLGQNIIFLIDNARCIVHLTTLYNKRYIFPEQSILVEINDQSIDPALGEGGYGLALNDFYPSGSSLNL